MSSTVLAVVFVRVFEGAAWAFFWPTIEAYVTEVVEQENAGRAMGMVSSSYGIAFATASLAGGTIAGLFGYWQTFAAYLVLSSLSIVLGVLLLPKSQLAELLKDENSGSNVGSAGVKSEATVLAYFIGGAYTFGLGAILTLFSVFAKSLGVAIVMIGFLFGFFWVGRIVGSFFGGRFSDRYGRSPAVIVAMVGSFIGLVLTALSYGAFTLFVGVGILGLSIGAVFPANVAIISDTVPRSMRGFAMGIFETSCAISFMLAATFGGLLSDLYSPRVPYLLAAAVSFGAVVIFAMKRSKLTS
jgi:MFS family permease